ncbi:MAG: hypothetical protein ACK6DR_13210 [Gemmatimonas sp.]|jgi:plastocyanin|uniref:hypothetical protein n=1 Tax=Gemmatimonas sp. TaxID=1962908 RepID=UPI0022C61BD5|nr:hypothetical protein [Gemmatimonas sp.]MCA2983887.1 hypothetical protein [Gemmatimonas sp.]MCA2988598.1 hypothetical protein [Gemmatimonas sp.]MCA2996165.1 hypothetical protein [Gemmatimonas sp.]MCE2953563.1 hypothetical protein [Gemmatimonas sp.]MCZ8010557.1 hypothetical protein [Gemmatimonas sp.]
MRRVIVRWSGRLSLVVVGAWAGAAAHAPLGAQASVRGQVRLIERAGAPSADLTDVIVALEGEAATAKRPTWMDRATVGMRRREFEPHVQLIGVGGSVAYPNQDPFSHNVFSNSALGAFDLGLYRSGKTRSATFNAPGVYAVYCNIHARMVNYVVAVRTPYVTRARANGSFEIGDVPPGTWMLRVWHERAAEHVETVRVTGDGVVLTVALDARGYVAKAHGNKFGQPYTATRADRY